jgi:hypothetical protein
MSENVQWPGLNLLDSDNVDSPTYPPPQFESWYFVDRASQYSLFYLYFQLDTLFSPVYIQCLGFLFPLHVSGLTGPSSGNLNCTCIQWYCPPLQVSLSCGRWERSSFIIRRSKLYKPPVVRRWEPQEFFLNGHTTKTPAEGESTTGCMYNLDLLMMGLWGLKYIEEGGNPDTVYRRKRIVYQVGNKDKHFERLLATSFACFCLQNWMIN